MKRHTVALSSITSTLGAGAEARMLSLLLPYITYLGCCYLSTKANALANTSPKFPMNFYSEYLSPPEVLSLLLLGRYHVTLPEKITTFLDTARMYS